MAKPIEDLTITDDFMFGAVMRDPKQCKPLLEMVLGVKINKIEYLEPQKSIAERYESKSIRLDVFVADEVGTVYDVEIQTESKKSLPKRTRYYQGMIDLHILEKGEDYASLKKALLSSSAPMILLAGTAECTPLRTAALRIRASRSATRQRRLS